MFFSHEHGLFLPSQKREGDLITLCSAEYQVMMGRVTNWTVLQYALWPIVIGFYAIIMDHASDIPPALLPWLLAAVLPVAYLAYQSAMIDALGYVLLVEGRLRPQVARIIGREDFWTYESVHRRTRGPNPAYWYGWPPLLSFASVLAGLFYAVRDPSHPWWSPAVGFAVTSTAATVVLRLTLRGRDLDRSVNLAVGLDTHGRTSGTSSPAPEMRLD
jgi:hypothetical protein